MSIEWLSVDSEVIVLSEEVSPDVLKEIADNYTVGCLSVEKRLAEVSLDVSSSVLNPLAACYVPDNGNIVIMPDKYTYLIFSERSSAWSSKKEYELYDCRVVNDYILDAIDLVFEKTGIIVPPSIFDVRDDAFFHSRRGKQTAIVNGFYRLNGIVIRPDVFAPFNLEVALRWFNEIGDNLVTDKNGRLKRETKTEYLSRMEEKHLYDIREVIVHEIGHWVHDNYWGYKPMYIQNRGGYARKNQKENFAVAFQQYVMDAVPKFSPRYKKMEEIITSKFTSPSKSKKNDIER